MATIGRPRDPTVDGAATAAAIRLIVEDGYANLTMERIAERAGVSKAALYRRWPNKVALVVDAVESSAHQKLTLPDTGDVRDDIVAFLDHFSRERDADAEVRDALSGAVESDRELGERCRRVLGAEVSAALRAIVGRGVDRGQLPAGTDVDLLADVLPALIRYRRQSSGSGPDDEFVRRVLRQFFRG